MCTLANFKKERDERDLGMLLLKKLGILVTRALCVETAGSGSHRCVGSLVPWIVRFMLSKLVLREVPRL